MGYIDRLVNSAQMAEMIYQQTKHWLKADESSFNDLEIELAAKFASMKTGKVFATKEWRFKTNTSSTCTKMQDSEGLSCEPSTDTAEGADDFLEYLPFQWWRCNYTRESDGFARPTAMEGTPGFRTAGAVDVGTIAATFYWKCEDHGTYRMWYMSDSPHPELGLVPWIGAIRADGTVMPYYIYSAYPTVTASDGKARSQPGLAPAYNHSYNGCVTLYSAKGTGYWGAGGDRIAHGYIFLLIKYATKNSQKKFAGCTSFDHHPAVAVAETSVTRVLIASSNTQFYAGCCVSVGTSTDRGNAAAHSTVNRARVKSVENVTVGGTTYIALNLDVSTAFDTTTSMYVSSMPCFAGETDAVIGKRDGSYLSNTDGRHTYRIHGVEYNWGQWCVVTDAVIEYLADNTRRGVYVAPKGVAHVANAHTNYILAGEMYETSGDSWIGDEMIDPQTGAMIPEVVGSGDSVGAGDRFYANAGTKGTLREYLALGYLSYGSSSGLCHVNSAYGLSHSRWYSGSCD